MRKAARRSVLLGFPALLLGSLLLLLPTLAQTAEAKPPRVDLERIRLDADGASAPYDGGRARLTLDPELQRTAYRLLARAHPVSGAIVAVDARTGKLLVWTEWQRARGKPGLLTSAEAPAASVFKIVTTTALLQEAKIRPGRRVCIRGGEHGISQSHLEAPRGGQKECAAFSRALGYSKNAVFAQLAHRFLGGEDLLKTAEQLGFNAQVPFDVPVPMGSLSIPEGELEYARTAAGFENSTLSPLGGAHLAYVAATGGWNVRLHIVESAGSYTAPKRRDVVRRVMMAWTARQLTKMMEVTVHSGTSLDAFSTEDGETYLPGVPVAGKTGTLSAPQSSVTTSWFVGFASSRGPRIVVSVLLQNGPVWRHKANHVARDLLRAYFAEHGWPKITHPFAPPKQASDD